MPGQSRPVSPTAPRLLLSVNDAAKHLAMGRTKFYELLTANEIPSIVLRGRRVVAHADLAAYVERLRADAGPFAEVPFVANRA